MIKNETITALKVFIIFSIITGIVYPLGITALAQLTMPNKANGSLIINEGQVIGSKLIGQNFTIQSIFTAVLQMQAKVMMLQIQERLILAPSSKKLISQVAAQIKQVRAENSFETGSTDSG